MGRYEGGRKNHTVSREVREKVGGQMYEERVEGDGSEVTVPYRRGTVLDLTSQHTSYITTSCLGRGVFR